MKTMQYASKLETEFDYIEVDLESLLHSIESGYANPNCYTETGTIRKKFREADRQTVIIKRGPYLQSGKPLLTIHKKTKQSL